ncbi:hypothetical protein PENARI_c092G05533 [Penicillium arizonense]|uniref:Uncharacterized protein n=1 Tax=Penicillium arizonense TaxID=1835702 RepID=A0A1F5L1H2_PENAI|nr:hypothetical protein PENARI_c092G05533 [Penicillium arizonense]OGE46896.1 hypothetical protein PENARI_c092G05533 [Penicillium arizonense]
MTTGGIDDESPGEDPIPMSVYPCPSLGNQTPSTDNLLVAGARAVQWVILVALGWHRERLMFCLDGRQNQKKVSQDDTPSTDRARSQVPSASGVVDSRLLEARESSHLCFVLPREVSLQQAERALQKALVYAPSGSVLQCTMSPSVKKDLLSISLAVSIIG